MTPDNKNMKINKVGRNLAALRKRVGFSNPQLILFVLVFAIIGGYILINSFAASVDCTNYPSAPSGTASINLCPTSVDHTLPTKFWGWGMSRFAYQDLEKSSYQQLFKATGAEILRNQEGRGQNPGTPSSPDPFLNDLRSFAQTMKSQGLDLGVILNMESGPASLPSSVSPATVSNYDQSGNRSPANEGAMVNWMMDGGVDVLGVEFYNEPDLNTAWYTGTTQTDSNKREAWAYVHQRQYADGVHQALAPKGRNTDIIGGVMSTGQGYGVTWAHDFFTGTGTIISDGGGWPWTTNNVASTSSGPIFDTYVNHPYPGPTGCGGQGVQGRLNSLAYPTVVNNCASSYYSFMEAVRSDLNSLGGSSKKLAFDEGGDDTCTNVSALDEGVYAVLAARNQARWNLPYFALWSSNTDSACGLADQNFPLFLTTDHVNFRDTIRSSAARDIIGKFLHNYKKQIAGPSTSTVAGSGMTPGDGLNNPVQRIQASAGISADGTKMAVLAINMDLSSSQNFQINMGTTPAGPITQTYMLNNTSAGNMPTATINTSSNNFTVNMQPGSEYLFEIPISTSGTAPTVTLNANPTSITAGASSTLSWSSTNATSCSTSGWSSSTGTSGSQSVSPAATTTYSITCVGSGGSSSTSTTVVVKAAPLSVPATSVTHTVDGSLSESDWKATNAINKIVSGSTGDTGSWGALWNSNYLYVGVKVNDTSLSTNPANDPGNYWQNDSVEVYIDPNGDGGTTYDSLDKQLAQGYNDSGLFGVSASTPGVLHAWAPVTGGYSIEMAIPWSSLGVTPANGMNLALDIGINDSVNGARVGQLMWNGTSNNWQDPSNFGSASLSGTPTTAVPGDANGDGAVNALDLSILLSHYGQTTTTADFNGDGAVNATDLSILLSHYG